MAIKKVLLEGHPLLREVMQPVPRVNGRVRRIIEDLKDTMMGTHCIGYAANQIGEPVRICIVYTNKWLRVNAATGYNPDAKQIIVLVNPQIVEAEGEQFTIEACASIPESAFWVPRFNRIVVKHIDGKVELTGEASIVAQHEIDHLDGVLISDYSDGTNGKSGGKVHYDARNNA